MHVPTRRHALVIPVCSRLSFYSKSPQSSEDWVALVGLLRCLGGFRGGRGLGVGLCRGRGRGRGTGGLLGGRSRLSLGYDMRWDREQIQQSTHTSTGTSGLG